MIKNMFNLYSMLKEQNINIIYNGPIWPESIVGLSETLKKHFEFDELPLPAAQAIFSVFIEQINNMLMYSEEKKIFKTSNGNDITATTGIFIIGSNNKKYFLQSGNIIKSSSVASLSGHIDYINTLSKVGIRKYYKECILEGNPNNKGKGAGLGLIEIAKRASSKLEYSFSSLEQNDFEIINFKNCHSEKKHRIAEDEFVFFSLHVTVG